MSNPATASITVPATTANIGPGFDCLGAALTLYNIFTFSLAEPDQDALVITAIGAESDRVQTDSSNLVYQAFTRLYQELGQAVPPVNINIELDVPLARGLGSSATAIVGGLLGANALAGFPLTREAVLQLAIAIEGHPDNVVPALMGGCRLAASGTSGWEICDIPWHPSITPIVAIPDFELSTAAARQVLPASYSRADAIFNTAHLGLLLRGLETGTADWVHAALHDRIHQPYRQKLIPGYDAVHAAALESGAHGLVISGAGPTLLALSDTTGAEIVRGAIATTWANQGITATVKVLHIDHQGAVIKS
ncbi:MAG: homoserine kinase [Leptolyngbyaceae cyanobacterium RU_5_1]|nr:homoserine kinase [Leptolyngbyaceae cyanobacterium RU_5_1]